MKLSKIALLVTTALMPFSVSNTALAQFQQGSGTATQGSGTNQGIETATTQGLSNANRGPQEITPAPERNINKKRVGWQEAGLGSNGDRVGSSLRANWVMLNEENGIEGQVVGITRPTTVYLLRSGFVVGRSQTDEQGNYQIESASPGPYTIVSYSPESVFSYSFNAVANDGRATDMPISLQTFPVVGTENVRLISKLIEQYGPRVEFSRNGQYDVGETASDPAEFYGWNGLRDLTTPSVPASSIRFHQIPIVDGRVVGRIHQMDHRSGRPVEIRNSRILLIQDGKMLSDTQADDLGVFEFNGLTSGTYGLLAIGADGIMIVGLDLVARESNDSQGSGTNETAWRTSDPLFSTVAYRQQENGPVVFDGTLGLPDSAGWLNNFVTEQAYINALNEPLPEIDQLNQIPFDFFDPNGVPGGGPGGNFFGGGGGGFGGGGFGGFGGGGLGGRILFPVGIAAIIAAAVDDDDLSIPVIPSSPF